MQAYVAPLLASDRVSDLAKRAQNRLKPDDRNLGHRLRDRDLGELVLIG
jgi:hypothetical protein